MTSLSRVDLIAEIEHVLKHPWNVAREDLSVLLRQCLPFLRAQREETTLDLVDPPSPGVGQE